MGRRRRGHCVVVDVRAESLANRVIHYGKATVGSVAAGSSTVSRSESTADNVGVFVIP